MPRRTIVTDNFYTGIELARELLDKNTHLIGTLGKNRKGLPKEVTSTNLKTGEMVGKEDSNCIVILKWRDQRDVYGLSTCHTLNKIAIGKKNRKNVDIVKPQFIAYYNMGKADIDLSDQLSSYSTSFRKSLRWYHKTATELLLGTAVVNAYIRYKSITKRNYVNILNFRENLWESLLERPQSNTKNVASKDVSSKHKIQQTEEKDDRNRKVRRRCLCYQKFRDAGKNCKEARDAAKKVSTICVTCDEKPNVCMNCFN
ncbi:hypothetical protein NQ314_021521 [Rhamnusium bicolor]|uniref:PiggyBac transposable element-derived protein domain-containing protein n=1 Tax=Rhamnusium bicolor TaxID=1586634 RepID=A0AAV8WHI1_9CUCU|nr:hypothetical protein NQ314_021521 [Rhamnusium bicolor]